MKNILILLLFLVTSVFANTPKDNCNSLAVYSFPNHIVFVNYSFNNENYEIYETILNTETGYKYEFNYHRYGNETLIITNSNIHFNLKNNNWWTFLPGIRRLLTTYNKYSLLYDSQYDNLYNNVICNKQ
jgi:hypothetical protein